MDLQFFGANCLSISQKGKRIIVDDNLADLGGKGIIKADDVALFTSSHASIIPARLVFDSPGEYEVADISIIGIAARAHIDNTDEKSGTMYKLVISDLNVLITGHIYPDLSDSQLETIGLVDILVVPVGGNGYTLDPIGALKIIKAIEPKLVIPTHYADPSLNYEVPQQNLNEALKELAMEPKETTSKLKVKAGDLSDIMQLVILEKT